MYGYEWTDQNGIYRLSVNSKIEKEIRPVFKEELDYFKFYEHWSYPDTRAPLLWAEGIRRYVLNGECVAEAVGGGYYTMPKINIKREGLTLEPIDIDALWNVNYDLLLGMQKTATDFIRSVYEEYSAKEMAFAVAFSGGKDSLLLLDLVSKALSPDQYFVVFSNTGMEISATIESVEKSKKHWPNLRFYEAKSHMDPLDSWDEFGPPGRRMRWCCAVHKSVPTILLLRELTRDYSIKAVVYDGVRAEESAKRASYDELGFGEKNINQINCHPILKWNTAELYPYLLYNGILFNEAYYKGLFRVGCAVCPMSSGWWDSIAYYNYGEDVKPLLAKIENLAKRAKPNGEVQKYVEGGGWKARMGGNILPNGGKRILETIDEYDAIAFRYPTTAQSWLAVAPILGPIVQYKDGVGIQLIGDKEYRFIVKQEGGSSNIQYCPYSRMDRYDISHLRAVVNKVAYCIGCKACSVQCPTGAFVLSAEGKIYIRSDYCIHCHNCLTFTQKGCLVAKSLASTGGNVMELKGMDRYKHFGIRRPWLDGIYQFGLDYFEMEKLGIKQYDSLRMWLRDAGLLSSANKGKKAGMFTVLFEKLRPLGSGNPLVWAIIWTNLAYNSIICKWYMLNVPAGDTYEKNELVFQLGDDYSQSTRDNAVTALLETFRHSPIGSVLKQGIPIAKGNSFKFSKQGWNTPDSVAILYALYMWAEATGRYDFSLKQMEAARGRADVLGVDPVSIFGINPERYRSILQDIALQYPEYLRTTFVADLDNVKLFPEHKSIDIVDLIQK